MQHSPPNLVPFLMGPNLEPPSFRICPKGQNQTNKKKQFSNREFPFNNYFQIITQNKRPDPKFVN